MFAITSDCFGGVAYGRGYYLTPYQSLLGRKYDNVNDVYFYDIPAEVKNKSIPLYAALMQRGVTLNFQNMGNLYECPDSGFDASSMGSLIGTLEAMQTDSTTAAVQNLIQKNVLQKADLAPYVLSQVNQNAAGAGGLAERYLEGSADFDQVLLGAYNDNHFLITWNKFQAPVQYDFMMLARNFATTMFFMGNPTFMPQHMSFFTEPKQNPLSRMYLRSYLNDLSKTTADADLIAQTKTAVGVTLDDKLRSK